jgi:aminopeptidase
MFSEKELKKIAGLTIERMKIGRKLNFGIELAKRKFGEKFVERLLKQKWVVPRDEKERKIFDKLEDPDYGPLLIKRGKRYWVKKKVGETVRIVHSINEEIERLVDFLKEEIWKRGCHVLDLRYSSQEERKSLKLKPWDTIAELPLSTKFLAKSINTRIFIGGLEDIFWAKGLEWKLKFSAKVSQKLREIIDRRKVKWLVFGWPIEKKQYLVDEGKYKKVFYAAIKETFKPSIQKYCKYYEKSLWGADRIKIVAADGTNLTFRIKGRPLLKADGKIDENDLKKGDVGVNIPDGEVYVAPLEHSANGYIKFDWVPIEGFGLVRDLKIKFKNGKIVWFDSPDRKIFKRFLSANTGEKDRIAEFGIGTNLKAEPIGETIVDEKIFGSIHIAIGNNQGTYHGKNRASCHLDMVKLMKEVDGRIYVDNKLIMQAGLPLKD